jgi:hypothetical protein
MYPGGTISPVYLWYKNGALVPAASGPSYTIALTKKATDDGAKIKCVVALPGLSQASTEATLHVTTDTVPPTLASAEGSPSFDKILVHFSEPVDNASATTIGNYSISPSLTISSATVQSNSTVVLQTSMQVKGTQYTITVNNVADLSGNKITDSAQFQQRLDHVRGHAAVGRHYYRPMD